MKKGHKIALGVAAAVGVTVVLFWDEVALAWLAITAAKSNEPAPSLPMQPSADESAPVEV